MKHLIFCIALLCSACSCFENSEYEIFTIAGEEFQVAKEDFPQKLSRDEANSACYKLGDFWRLPSEMELLEMYNQLHTKGKGGFQNDIYIADSHYYPTVLNFKNGEMAAIISPYKKHLVRPVRNLRQVEFLKNNQKVN